MSIVNSDELRKIYCNLEVLEKKREELIKLCRDVRIHSTKAIAKIHAGKMKEAEEHINEAKKILEKVLDYKEYPFYRAITGEAMQEFVESIVFSCFVKRKTTPTFESIEYPSILTGYADVVGELRRYALDLMRYGEISKAEECIVAMEEIYNHLIQFSFPEKLVPNLRHKVDLARNLIDRTKSDLIAAKLLKLIEGR